METEQQIKALVDKLIDHAYDSGYYSGQKLDGQPLHEQAIGWEPDINDGVRAEGDARRACLEGRELAARVADALRKDAEGSALLEHLEERLEGGAVVERALALVIHAPFDRNRAEDPEERSQQE